MSLLKRLAIKICMMVQSPHKEPKPHEPSTDLITRSPSVRMDISADRTVDDIVKDLENAPSQQPLRKSERLSPPVIQPPEPEPRCSKHLKHQANLLITEDPDIESPFPVYSLLCEVKEGSGMVGEVLDEAPVEVCEPEEGLDFTFSSRSWPLRNSGHFYWVHPHFSFRDNKCT